MNDHLAELQLEYNALCQRIEPSAGHYSFLTEREDNGAPHVEYADGVYYHVVTERGLELERELFTDKDDLLYRLVSDMAFWLAVDYEFKNRVEGQDARRIIFAKCVELMERIGPEWAEKTHAHIAETLIENPYLDQ
jgi:hypothetical protein